MTFTARIDENGRCPCCGRSMRLDANIEEALIYPIMPKPDVTYIPRLQRPNGIIETTVCPPRKDDP